MADPKIPADKPPGVPARKPDADAQAAKADDNLDENGDPWRHPPVAPKDQGILESLGRSISDPVLAPLEDKDGKPKL
ncbi:MAG: hypothetical protein ABI745_16305 [Caldimonas sp.]